MTSAHNPVASDRPTLARSQCSWRAFDPASFSIVIADDSKEIRVGLRTALKREGYQVHEVDNGEALIEHVSGNPADLVLLDVMMPQKDGLTVLRELRDDPKLASIYVILLTGRSSVEEKVEGLRVGADDYLTKPFDLKELLARVQAGIRIKAMHRELIESQKTLIRQEKRATIGRLAAGIAHEFNNLMSAISGYAQLARNNEKYRERLIEVALSQVKRAQRITSSLSTFAASGGGGSQRAPVLPLVESSLCLMEKEFKTREISVSVEMSENLPLVLVEKGQMQQVFLHLLINAAQAAGKGGQVEVRGGTAGGRLWIEVDDDGPGVPESIGNSIFDPFFTTKGALGNAEEPGTGLGLSFSLNTVQEFGGTLDLVPSRLGGACFRVELPALQATTSAPPAPLSGSVPRRIVLVEDDPDLQEIVGELLADEDLEVFAEGEAAFAHLTAHPVDAVIVDLQLQGDWTGERLLEEIDRLTSKPAVIVTTGSVEVTPELLPACVHSVVRKPYSLGDLQAALAGSSTHA